MTWRARTDAALLLAFVHLLGACSASVKAPEAVGPDASPTVISASTVVLSREPWRYQAADGTQITTKYYRIMTTAPEGTLRRRLPLFLETALAAYMTEFGPLPAPKTKLDTYLMSTRPQWELLTQQIMGDRADQFLVIGRGGFASGGRGVFWDIGIQGTFVIAAHEGWHQYLQRTFKHRVPVWLDEGLATYMEAFRWDSSGSGRPIFTGWSNVERFDHLRAASSAGGLVSLEELLNQTPQELIQRSDELALTYYAQVWALTHFLREGEGGKYKEKLHRLLLDAATGRLARVVQARGAASPRQAAQMLARGPGVFMLYFNPDLKEASREYDAFVRQVVATGSKDKVVAGVSPITGRRPPR